MSPRSPPKISLRLDWTKELGSKVVQQPEGKVVQQPEGEVARQSKILPTNPTKFKVQIVIDQGNLISRKT